MNRLQSELHRLFSPREGERAGAGTTRVMVLEVAAPAGWHALSRVWQGVQADLQLPPPAIAINGTDGYQLWFALAEPVPAEQALSFLASLQRRYLGDVPRDRVRLHPAVANPPPALAAPGQWSAFLAPDLAALFADERWLDLAPSPEAQGELLSHLQCTKAADLQRAMQEIASVPVPVPATASGTPGEHQDPRSFLLTVMNDPAVDLQLRIEAAKALLHP